jgi:NAD(P)-dependent dehydrogenase (short-subunit alcohol dehydrogenase family)
MIADYRAKPEDGVAWVTGASSGIGRATALELARRGYTVAVTARRLPDLDALSRESCGSGRIVAFPADVTDSGSCAAAVDGIEKALGPIALAFLNAGVYIPVSGTRIDVAAFHRTFDVNVLGTVHCLAAVLPRMADRAKGQIAINASVAGYGGLPRAAAYGAAKAALINMAQALSFDAGPAGVRIQIVNPGFVDTPATAVNDFPMPFLIGVEEASRRVADGFERSGFEIAFPKRFVLLLKLLNLLPYDLYLRLVGRTTGGGGGAKASGPPAD